MITMSSIVADAVTQLDAASVRGGFPAIGQTTAAGGFNKAVFSKLSTPVFIKNAPVGERVSFLPSRSVSGDEAGGLFAMHDQAQHDVGQRRGPTERDDSLPAELSQAGSYAAPRRI